MKVNFTRSCTSTQCMQYLTIRPVARKGYGSIAHEAKPNGLLIRGHLRAKGLIVLVSPN